VKGQAAEVRGPVHAFLHDWKGRFLRSIEKRGTTETLLLSVSAARQIMSRKLFLWLTWNPFNPWRQYLDRRYDRRFGVDTAGIDWIADVELESANAYSPVPRSTFISVMRQLDLDHRKFVFVDFGCGKGKTLLLAAESPYKQAIGVEISPRLTRIAEDNVRNYKGARRCSSFKVVCADAAQYVLPQVPAVIFFYDPFKRDVMTAVIENMRRSLAAEPRETYIVYLDPSWKVVLDSAWFLVPLKETRSYCIYKSKPV